MLKRVLVSATKCEAAGEGFRTPDCDDRWATVVLDVTVTSVDITNNLKNFP